MADENNTPEAEGKTSGKKTQNLINLRGNIGSEIRENDMGDGKSALSFSVATAESYKDGDDWKQRKPEFTNVNITNQPQVAAIKKAMEENDFGKGSQISMEGHINRRSYEKDGNTVYVTEVSPRTGKTALQTDFPDLEGGRKDYKQINKAELAGFMVEEPTFGKTSNGKDFMNATIAMDYGIKDKETGAFTNKTTFMDLTSFSPKMIEAAKTSVDNGDLGKGSLVGVTGRLQGRSFERADGSKGYASDIGMRGTLEIKEVSTAKREAEATKTSEAKATKGAKDKDQEIPF